MKLLVISHTPHYRYGKNIVGWGPTVRELDYLSTLFEQTVHLAPLYPDPAPPSALPYQSSRIWLHPLKPSGGQGLGDKLGVIAHYPAYAWTILKELRQTDVVHIRCPANISLLAILLLGLVRQPKYRWVKYAGNWQPEGKEPWSYTLQRWWLQKGFHKGIVTVNGDRPSQPKHVYPFHNPCLSADELSSGQQVSHQKELQQPIQLLFIGRLENAKGAGRTLEIANLLSSAGIDFRLRMIGDGPGRSQYELFIKTLDLSEKVDLLGWLPKTELMDYYEPAHFILLPSTASEGWPKVLSEGMAYGVVPLAGAVSSIPQILQESEAGLALPPCNPRAYLQAIQDYLAEPERWKQASLKGIEFAPDFSYMKYLEKVRETFQEAWSLFLPKFSSLGKFL